MDPVLLKVAGAAVVLLALADLFLTVLHTRGDAPFLSTRLNHAIWVVLRRMGPEARSLAGPLALVLTVGMWVSLVTLGFALISWPDLGHGIRHMLGGPAPDDFFTAIYYSGMALTTLGLGDFMPVTHFARAALLTEALITAQAALVGSARWEWAVGGPAPDDFFTAIYYSGMALTTLGLGDFMPVTHFARAALLTEALLGFSMVTLSLTYFLSIYNTLIRRNAFAAEMHYMSARTGDAAELLARIGSEGRFGSEARSELAAVARELLTLLQTHHAFPVVHLFTQRDVAMSPPRVALLALDSASLVRSVLDPDLNRDLIASAAVETLWDGGMQLLIETGNDILTDADRDATRPQRDEWRDRYRAAAARLSAAGYKIDPDERRGLAAYERQRKHWDAHIRAFATYMGLDWDEIERPRCRETDAAA